MNMKINTKGLYYSIRKIFINNWYFKYSHNMYVLYTVYSIRVFAVILIQNRELVLSDNIEAASRPPVPGSKLGQGPPQCSLRGGRSHCNTVQIM